MIIAWKNLAVSVEIGGQTQIYLRFANIAFLVRTFVQGSKTPYPTCFMFRMILFWGATRYRVPIDVVALL